MISALGKDIYRDIKKSRGRFISILAIVALGVAFFTGIKVAPLVMKSSADKYYDNYNLMDIRVISTLGLSEESINLIKSIKDIEGISGSKSIDVLGSFDSKDTVFKAISLPSNLEETQNEDYINRVNLIDGRMPENSNECLVEQGSLDINTIPIGTKITFFSGNDTDLSSELKNVEYEVVGTVQTPYYLTYEKGKSNIGSGNIESFVLLPEDNFKSDIFSEAYITVKGAKDVNSYDAEKYFEIIEGVKENVESLSNEINSKRYDEVVSSVLQSFGVDNIESLSESNPMYINIKKVIDNIEKPNLLVLDRNSHYSYVDYKNSADSVDALAKIFPVFFFLVAALVCLTTMTRMVDEQRGNIGTLKALGYSKGKIAVKYLIYSLTASLTGSIIGVIIGFTVFPIVVFNAYGMMYSIPDMKYVFDVKLAIIATTVAVSVTVISAISVCYKELSETPSTLMRPRAPKLGKRIILERVPFIWNRLNFTGKVTVRNILRYKKRFFMTVIGVAGCTALLLTGFGIKDSIKTIVDKQFGSIFNYDASISLDKGLNEENLNDVYESIENIDGVTNLASISTQNGSIINGDKSKEVSIMIPEDIENFDKLINLSNRISGEDIEINDNGIVLIEKLAKEIDVKVGETITITNSKNIHKDVKVTGIAENYVGHYMYMSRELYEESFDEDLIFTNIIAKLNSNNEDFENSISRALLDINGVEGVSFNTAIKTNFDNTVKNLNYVVLILILSAGALAFVVLYNLTNVNISERMREIATIKVLGFYDNEVANYVYRENLVLTLIGTIVGLGLGTILHKFIMVTVEMEAMMFGRNIDGMSYIYSAVLTLVFAAIVNYAMYYKLKNIEMVESLKSVE